MFLNVVLRLHLLVRMQKQIQSVGSRGVCHLGANQVDFMQTQLGLAQLSRWCSCVYSEPPVSAAEHVPGTEARKH